ncbi:MAG: hypothetical protein IAF38_06875 [Bacteroidia bacterium]|nr:hypothetical protein [Bacteroidia bacterium]
MSIKAQPKPPNIKATTLVLMGINFLIFGVNNITHTIAQKENSASEIAGILRGPIS